MPTSSRGFSIRVKAIGSYLAITLLGLVCASLALSLQFDAAEEMATLEAENVAGAIVRSIGDHPLANVVALQRGVSMFHDSDARDAFVIDRERRIIADVDPIEIGSRFPPVHHNAVALTLADGRTRAFIDAAAGNSAPLRELVVALRERRGDPASPIVGAFIVEYTRAHDAMLARARRATYVIAAMGAGFLLLATALGLRFAAAISAPLRKLTAGATAIAQGKYDTRFNVKARDEIGALAAAFNQMAADLGAAHAGALEHQRELERRVAERTREWKRAAAAQRESAAELRLIAESMPVGLCYLDRDLRYRYHNAQYLRLMGMPGREIDGLPVIEVLGRELFAEIEGQIARVRDGERLVAERAHVDAAGRERHLQIALVPRIDELGAVLGYYLMLQDISERKDAERALRRRNDDLVAVNLQLQQAQNQLLQSERMASIGQLASGVAHEINNPIGYVQSNLGTLDRYLDGIFDVIACHESAQAAIADPEARARIEQARKAADIDFVRDDVRALVSQSKDGITRVAKIVSDLKGYSRSTSDEAWQPADLHAGIDSTLNIVWNEIKYKAEVQKHFGELPPVECRPSQLNQVFMNLFVNAAQAIRRQGMITISTGVEGSRAWVEVADTGEGIDPTHLGRIFEPFFTTKPVGKGTGLGLALAYGIVKDHAGEITVESTVGRGTAFRVWLPIRQLAARADLPGVIAS
jgi:PAS domain S-box-containing protein